MLLTAVEIRLSIEGYTYSLVVFDGNCSEIDVRFFPSQETFTPEYHGAGSEVHSHCSVQAVGKFKQQEKVIIVRLN